MKFEPTLPSRETPHVEVKVGGAPLKFWMNPGARVSRRTMKRTLHGIPFGLAWRMYALASSKHACQSKYTQSPTGFHFELHTSKGDCTPEQFGTAFKTFQDEVMEAAALAGAFG